MPKDEACGFRVQSRRCSNSRYFPSRKVKRRRRRRGHAIRRLRMELASTEYAKHQSEAGMSGRRQYMRAIRLRCKFCSPCQIWIYGGRGCGMDSACDGVDILMTVFILLFHILDIKRYISLIVKYHLSTPSPTRTDQS
jgi:hypothetical protein